MLQHLSLDSVFPDPDQPRKTFYEDSLNELAQSIKERGVLEPIVVRPKDGGYQIIMGERRWRASRIAGLTHIPAIIRETSDEEASVDSLLENFQREDLNPIERAQAIEGLLKFLSWDQVAKNLGVTVSTLKRHLELLELPDYVQDDLRRPPAAASEEGRVLEGHARHLLTLADKPEMQKRVLAKIKAEKLTVGDTEKLLAAMEKMPDKTEAFLRVPLDVTQQILKNAGKHRDQVRPYKKQTADQHLKDIVKAGNALCDLLDEEIIKFLTPEQNNQLLSTCTGIRNELDDFAVMLRKAMQGKDVGFKEVYVNCPLCGRIELIGSVRCSVCWTILRRCLDCGNYDRTYQRCAALGTNIYVSEAENPKDNSRSYKCADYKPRFEPRKSKPQAPTSARKPLVIR
ncbi:MAG: ParB/RepB/Spo0J family partition protein [Armatimonadetes bacterium]|nr:ParB/RepB/Spo0J family partition protein [Armatimonadota bacterium]